MNLSHKKTEYKQLTIPLIFPENQCIATMHGETNQTILQIALRFINVNESRIFYIYANKGEGKTHFLKAVCAETLESEKNVAYIPLKDTIIYDPNILNGLEDYDVLAIDDINLVKNNIAWQKEIFHLINRIVYYTHCKLFISGNSLPFKLGIKLNDLTSRLNWGHLYKLTPLDEKNYITALIQRAEGKGLIINEKVAKFLFKLTKSKKGQIFDVLEHLDDLSMETKRKITIPFIKGVLYKCFIK